MKTKEKETPKKSLPKVDPSLSQTAATAQKETQPPTPVTPETTTQPVTAPAAPEPKKEQPKKETKPSISTVTRSLVIDHPDKSVDDLVPLLVAAGFADAAGRKSTVATLRTDCLAILKLVKEKGKLKE